MTLLNDFVMIEAETPKDEKGEPLKDKWGNLVEITSSTPFRGKVVLIGHGVKPWHEQHYPEGIRCGDRVLANGYVVKNDQKCIVKFGNIIGKYEKGE